MAEGTTSGPLRRVAAIGRFAATQLGAQLRRRPGRIAVTVGLVAVTIALLVVVTGISVALAGGTTTNDEVDLRVTPHDGGTLSPVVGVEGPRLDDVHERTATIDDRADVDYATPVLLEIVQVRTVDGGEPTNVLAVGVVPGEETPPVAGISTARLDPGDPYYAGGDYDGSQTGDVVLSSGAADQLNASTADPLLIRSPRSGAVSQSHEVTAVDDAATTGVTGDLPIVVLRLSELQTLTGAAEEDLADQVLVGTESAEAKAAIEETYPDATVESGDASGLAELREDDLALATSVTMLVVGIGICTLFIATTSGLLVERERRTLAVLTAVGFPRRSRLAIISVMSLSLTVVGGVVGIVLGYAGIALTNAVAMATVTSSPIAATDPRFIPYGLSVAIIAGVLALPYPLYLATNTDVIAELQR
ncbi:FtsX-like permease family protein [Natrialbaceae archaeon GCM10025810]|uniref:FtsX-like permease family protein n=1 Tax=Halovalidus salilacus TaxID=3075124 RepID=UPI0036246137